MHSLSEHFYTVVAAARRLGGNIPFKDILKSSESPLGFAMIAGAGLFAVVMLNIPGGTNEPATGASPVSKIDEGKDGRDEEASLTRNNGTSAPDVSAAPAEPEVVSLDLRRGETLIGLMKRSGVKNSNAHTVVNALKDVTNLRKLQRGQTIRLTKQINGSGNIDTIWIRDEFSNEAVARYNGSGYDAAREPVRAISLTQLVEGTITDNLYLSAKRAGLPDSVIIELIRMMSFNVDFEREIRQGDTFQVYFERRYAPEFNDTENGRILHVDLGLKRRPVNATWFGDSDSNGDYFDDSGASTRRALMKTPLDVAVVTSRYGKRKHPVLGYTRMHKGVDFRAPTGTPIMAAGDGVVEMAARNGSYGNYIRIRHNDTYKTAYGHLSRFGKGIKRGKRVKQGQVIGYSGATGRVTAAHLHYEVLVAGKQSNPMTLKLPTGRVLEGENFEQFIQTRNVIVADIDRIKERDLQMAQNGLNVAQAR